MGIRLAAKILKLESIFIEHSLMHFVADCVICDFDLCEQVKFDLEALNARFKQI